MVLLGASVEGIGGNEQRSLVPRLVFLLRELSKHGVGLRLLERACLLGVLFLSEGHLLAVGDLGVSGGKISSNLRFFPAMAGSHSARKAEVADCCPAGTLHQIPPSGRY